jgi:hypothetical protein
MTILFQLAGLSLAVRPFLAPLPGTAETALSVSTMIRGNVE